MIFPLYGDDVVFAQPYDLIPYYDNKCLPTIFTSCINCHLVVIKWLLFGYSNIANVAAELLC